MRITKLISNIDTTTTDTIIITMKIMNIKVKAIIEVGVFMKIKEKKGTNLNHINQKGHHTIQIEEQVTLKNTILIMIIMTMNIMN